MYMKIYIDDVNNLIQTGEEGPCKNVKILLIPIKSHGKKLNF